ncbi:MAG: type II secretion system secretin GspD [Myxococcaceae bacterium]|nr:type II secretion system secretin GspD [Myxococcaceae bacterium]
MQRGPRQISPRPGTPPPGNTGRNAAATPDRNAEATIKPGTAGQTPEEKQKTCEEIRKRAKFNIYFDKVEIEKLVQTVSNATCKTFILPENVRGKISIIGPENGKAEVNADQFYRAFLAALDANGLAVYQHGQFLKIVDKRNAKQGPIPTITDPNGDYTSAEQMITKLFRVRYVDVEPLRGVLQQLVSQNGDTIPFPPDIIIVNDVGSNMHRLERIIKQLDSRSSSDEMRVIQINYATAQDVADKIQKLFQPQGGQPGARAGGRGAVRKGGVARGAIAQPPPGNGAPALAGEEEEGGEAGPVSVSQIIPDERTNKLIVIASPAGFERIEELIKLLDVPIPGEGRINVYYLENADAEEMASTLSSLASGTSNRPARPPTPAQGQARAPAQAAELFSGEVKISADKATNSLVIIASQADYRNLVKVIEKLDVPRKQVFVEAVIMEVNTDRNSALGARLHGGYGIPSNDGTLPLIFGTKFGNESLPPSFSITSLASFGGFLAGLQGPLIPGLKETLGIDIPAFGIVIHALSQSSDVNVLSTPHILTSDNEEAEITVGQNVPFQAGVAPGALSGLTGLTGATGTNAAAAALTSGLFSSFVTPINRQNVELKLTVKPQINESDYIRLVISEQTEEIASTDPVLGPTTSKRTAKTTIVAKDQETVVIGGIMQDRTVEGVNKVPVLGDIPLIGHLFREATHKKVKTNLLLFLTPYIIKDQSDFRRIFERKMKERQQFVETFYGAAPGYEVAVDWDRKKGPLAMIGSTLRKEAQKVENGGPGLNGEKVIAPMGGGTIGKPPAQGEEGGVEEGGQETAPPEGGEVAPEGEAPQAPDGSMESPSVPPEEAPPPAEPEQGGQIE